MVILCPWLDLIQIEWLLAKLANMSIMRKLRNSYVANYTRYIEKIEVAKSAGAPWMQSTSWICSSYASSKNKFKTGLDIAQYTAGYYACRHGGLRRRQLPYTQSLVAFSSVISPANKSWFLLRSTSMARQTVVTYTFQVDGKSKIPRSDFGPLPESEFRRMKNVSCQPGRRAFLIHLPNTPSGCS